MAASYAAEQVAQQTSRVAGYARQGLQASAGLAADFEDQMGRVAALTTRGMSAEQAEDTYDALSAKARDLGATTRYTAREAGAGMEFLAMAGFDAQKQMETIPAVLSLATVGHLGVSRAADIATNIMGQFEIQADKSGVVIDRLAAALTSGNVNMEELGVAMSYSGKQAKDFGMDLESTLGWLDVLGDAGIKGSKAGTGITSMLISLSGAAKDPQQQTKKEKRQAKIFKDYGIALTDKDGNIRDGTEIMAQLGLAMAKSGKTNVEKIGELQTIFGKIHAGKAAVIMSSAAKGLGAMDTDLASLSAAMGADVTEDQRKAIWEGQALQSRIGKVRESDGLAGEMAKKMEATTKGQWREFQSQMEETGIVIGEQVLPLLSDLMKQATPVLLEATEWAKENKDTVKFFAKAAIALTMVSAVLTPTLTIVSALLSLLGLAGKGYQGAKALAARLGLGAGGGVVAGGGGSGRGRAPTTQTVGRGPSRPAPAPKGGPNLAPVTAAPTQKKAPKVTAGGLFNVASAVGLAWWAGTSLGEMANEHFDADNKLAALREKTSGLGAELDRLDALNASTKDGGLGISFTDAKGRERSEAEILKAQRDRLLADVEAKRGLLDDSFTFGGIKNDIEKLHAYSQEERMAGKMGASNTRIDQYLQAQSDLARFDARNADALGLGVLERTDKDVWDLMRVDIFDKMRADASRKPEGEGGGLGSVLKKALLGESGGSGGAGLISAIATALETAIVRGIEKGASENTIRALVPGADPMTGAEVGG